MREGSKGRSVRIKHMLQDNILSMYVQKYFRWSHQKAAAVTCESENFLLRGFHQNTRNKP